MVEFEDRTLPSVAIEVETDINLDFGASLRQVKKYQKRFPKVIVIIPKEYERFVPLYKNESLRVWLWSATRIWECLRCGNIAYENRPITGFKCLGKGCGSKEHRLKGTTDEAFVEP